MYETKTKRHRNYSSFFYPLPSLKFGGELSGANCPGGELSGIRSTAVANFVDKLF